jgi:hypothetical protein
MCTLERFLHARHGVSADLSPDSHWARNSCALLASEGAGSERRVLGHAELEEVLRGESGL